MLEAEAACRSPSGCRYSVDQAKACRPSSNGSSTSISHFVRRRSCRRPNGADIPVGLVFRRASVHGGAQIVAVRHATSGLRAAYASSTIWTARMPGRSPKLRGFSTLGGPPAEQQQFAHHHGREHSQTLMSANGRRRRLCRPFQFADISVVSDEALTTPPQPVRHSPNRIDFSTCRTHREP